MTILNFKNPISDARQPRGIVKIGDKLLTGWLDLEFDNNSFYQADTFRICFSLSALPPEFNDAWWASQTEVMAEILVGFPVDAEKYTETDLDSMIYGRVDDMEYDPAGRTLMISGRDLTAKLIDNKTTEKWPNLTSSQIVEQIAAKNGMTPVVTKTESIAGRYYEIDHVTLTDEKSEWDLISYLARQEGFAAYVKGRELHFEPKPTPDGDVYMLKWQPPTDEIGYYQFNGMRMGFSRNLTVSRGVQVTVRSWNQKSKRGFTVTYPTKGKGIKPGQATQKAQQYSYTFPNLTLEQATQKAQKLHSEIIQHEMNLSAELPGDNYLTPQVMVQVVGTATAYDQMYYPASIRRTLSMEGGYRMTLSAKNHAPDSQPSL